eukprot:9490556-Pyramimonas_sp.AAC.1
MVTRRVLYDREEWTKRMSPPPRRSRTATKGQQAVAPSSSAAATQGRGPGPSSTPRRPHSTAANKVVAKAESTVPVVGACPAKAPQAGHADPALLHVDVLVILPTTLDGGSPPEAAGEGGRQSGHDVEQLHLLGQTGAASPAPRRTAADSSSAKQELPQLGLAPGSCRLTASNSVVCMLGGPLVQRGPEAVGDAPELVEVRRRVGVRTPVGLHLHESPTLSPAICIPDSTKRLLSVHQAEAGGRRIRNVDLVGEGRTQIDLGQETGDGGHAELPADRRGKRCPPPTAVADEVVHALQDGQQAGLQPQEGHGVPRPDAELGPRRVAPLQQGLGGEVEAPDPLGLLAHAAVGPAQHQAQTLQLLHRHVRGVQGQPRLGSPLLEGPHPVLGVDGRAPHPREVVHVHGGQRPPRAQEGRRTLVSKELPISISSRASNLLSDSLLGEVQRPGPTHR